MATRNQVAPAKKVPRAAAKPAKSAKGAKGAKGAEKTKAGRAAVKPARVESDYIHPINGDFPPKVRAFIVEYLKDKNATQAYVRAYGCSLATADTNGSRLLGNARVRAEVSRLEAEQLASVQHSTGITLERTLREVARLAFFDPRRMFDAGGNPLPLHQLDDDTAAVIAGLDVLEEWEGTGDNRVFVGFIKKWKLSDKKGALDMLMKHLGGYKADNEQGGKAAAEALKGLAIRFVEAGQE